MPTTYAVAAQVSKAHLVDKKGCFATRTTVGAVALLRIATPKPARTTITASRANAILLYALLRTAKKVIAPQLTILYLYPKHMLDVFVKETIKTRASPPAEWDDDSQMPEY